MATYVYARRKVDAEGWRARNNIRPRDCHTFGTQSRWRDGAVYHPTDRVVVLGEINPVWEAAITRNLARAPEPGPVVIRIPFNGLTRHGNTTGTRSRTASGSSAE